MASFFVDNSAPDFLFIRPSGNPLDAKRCKQMIIGDIVQERAEIKRIYPSEFINENVAICILTLDSKLLTKGHIMMTYQQSLQFLKK